MPTAKELAAALERLQKNERVSLIRVNVADDACPVCHSLEGAYSKGEVPVLPPDGCSCPRGIARVYYAPVLEEIYP
jgi:hypothetical protein